MGVEQEVRTELRAGVRWIILDRPESRNGLTVPVAERMTALVEEARQEAASRVLVVTGASGAFCSGADIKAALMNGGGDVQAGLGAFQGFVRALRRVMKPTIAAVDGAAAGFGADIAVACDIRLASPGARLGQRFVGIGLMPDGGSTYLLPRLVGYGRAMEMIYSGRMVDAEEGLRIGLFNHILPAEGFQEQVQAWAAELAQGPALAFAESKQAVLAHYDHVDAALRAEEAGQLRLFASADFMEGVQAFLMKRRPEFKGQ